MLRSQDIYSLNKMNKYIIIIIIIIIIIDDDGAVIKGHLHERKCKL